MPMCGHDGHRRCAKPNLRLSIYISAKNTHTHTHIHAINPYLARKSPGHRAIYIPSRKIHTRCVFPMTQVDRQEADFRVCNNFPHTSIFTELYCVVNATCISGKSKQCMRIYVYTEYVDDHFRYIFVSIIHEWKPRGEHTGQVDDFNSKHIYIYIDTKEMR